MRVAVNGSLVATGRSKVGCFLGDHVKMGLGTLLNTGTNIGVCCNLLPSGTYVPKYVPSFASWWNGRIVDRADLEQLLDTANTVMARRQRGRVWARLGDVSFQSGASAQGDHSFRQALSIQKALVEEFPDEPRYRADLALTHALHARVLLRRAPPGRVRRPYRLEPLRLDPPA